MNYIINKCLLAGDRFMADIHFKRSRFTYSDTDDLLKITKKQNNIKKEEILNIFIEMN